MGRDPLTRCDDERGGGGGSAAGRLRDHAAGVRRLPEGLVRHPAAVRQVRAVEHDARAGRARVGVALPEPHGAGLGPGAGPRAHAADSDLTTSPETRAEAQAERGSGGAEVPRYAVGRVRLAVGRDGHVLGGAVTVDHDAHATRADRVERRGQRHVHRVAPAGAGPDGGGGRGAGPAVAGLARAAAHVAAAAVEHVGLQVAARRAAAQGAARLAGRGGRGRGAGVGGGRLAAVGRAVAVAGADAVTAHRTRGTAVGGRGGAGVGRGGGRRHLTDVGRAAVEGGGADEHENGDERAGRGDVHGVFVSISDWRISAASLRGVGGTGEPRSQPPCDGRQ